MRVFARRERPPPGAHLTLFDACGPPTGPPLPGAGEAAYIDAAHPVQARVEDVIRTGKDTGLGHFPSLDFQVKAAWPTATMIAAIVLAWLTPLALDGNQAKAEPKTLRYSSFTPRPGWCVAAGNGA